MTNAKISFHTESRAPYPEELPVVEAAHRIAKVIAERHNIPEGAPLFLRAFPPMAPSTHRAVDMIRGFIADNGVEVVAAAARTRALAVFDYATRHGAQPVAPRTSKTTELLDACRAASLRRMGF